jgi:hypothetical protein
MKNERFSPNERQARGGAGNDPAFTPFVTASIDEIRYAQRLRERLKERYPNRPSRPTAYWSVGAD